MTLASYVGDEKTVRAQVAQAIAESQPAPEITVSIEEHYNPFEQRTELYVTLFHQLGFSFGMRALDIAHSERLYGKMRRDPLGWLAKLMGNPVQAVVEAERH